MRSSRLMLNSIAGHDIIDQYGDAPETDSTQEDQELAPFGDDHISRAQTCCWEIVKNVQGAEIQLSATNPYVYNSGTGQVDKPDKHTHNRVSLFFTALEKIFTFLVPA